MNTKTLTFSVEPFYYTIVYEEETLTIEMVDQLDFFTWHTVITNTSIPTATHGPNLLNLTPEVVFEIFENNVHGMHDDSVKIKYPLKYEASTSPINIEIVLTALVFGKTVTDLKIIDLNAKNVDYQERNNNKINHLICSMDTKMKEMTETIHYLNKKVKLLNKKLDEMNILSAISDVKTGIDHLTVISDKFQTKAWGKINSTAEILEHYNVKSVSSRSFGIYEVTLKHVFPNSNYSIITGLNFKEGAEAGLINVYNQTPTSFTVSIHNNEGFQRLPTSWYFVVYGH